MTQYRKKPVVIEAIQFTGDCAAIDAFVARWHEDDDGPAMSEMADGSLLVETLEDGPGGEAKHVASIGDWIIRGVKGEFYPVKPDIFAATYELVAPKETPE